MKNCSHLKKCKTNLTTKILCHIAKIKVSDELLNKHAYEWTFFKISKEMFAQHWFLPILSHKKIFQEIYERKIASLFIF
jgi:hypothetical protein